MKFKHLYLIFLFYSCATKNDNNENGLIYPDEKHFKSIRQITFGGDNAEAYWSFDDKNLVFQSNNEKWNVDCDQMFLMNFHDSFEENSPKMISIGQHVHILPDKHIFMLTLANI